MTSWYVDPRITSGQESDNFDGGAGVGRLRDSWADVTWSSTDSYFGACGSTHVGAITIAASGASAAAPIRIGLYGLGPLPVINANGAASTGCFYASGRSNIEISDFELTGATAFPTAGVHTINCSNVTVRRCWSHGNEYGIRYDNAGSAEITGFTLERCLIEDSEQSGVIVVTGTSTGGTIRGVRIVGNNIRRSGLVVRNNGIHIATRLATNVAYDPTRTVFDATIAGNIVNGTTSYGMMLRYVDGLRVANNEVTGSGSMQDTDTHCIWMGGCKNTLVEFNEVHDNFGWEGGSAGSGCGIYVDQGAIGLSSGHACEDVTVRWNHIYDQWQGTHSGIHASAAIIVYRGQGVKIYGNVIERCRNGIAVRGASVMNSEDIEIHNNNCTDIAEVAFPTSNLASGVDVRNNLALRAAVGFWQESGASAVVSSGHTYNCAWECATPWASGTLAAMTPLSAGVGEFVADPAIDDEGRPRTESPLLFAGEHTGYVRDLLGVQRSNPPCIGAYDVATLRRAIV